MVRVRGGSTGCLQRKRANGKKIVLPMRRRNTGRWAGAGVNLDGNQLIDIEDEVAHILLRSGSKDEEDNSDEIKALKV
jgi:hypothetical protein